jgi:hypothetical protein
MTTFIITKRSEKPPGWYVDEVGLPPHALGVTIVEDGYWDGPVKVGDVVGCRKGDDRWHFYKRKPIGERE